MATWWDVLTQLATMLVGAIVGWGGVPAVVDWLKAKLGWHGEAAAVLAWLVSALFAFLSLFAVGQILPEHFTPDALPGLVLMVLLASQVAYNRRKRAA